MFGTKSAKNIRAKDMVPVVIYSKSNQECANMSYKDAKTLLTTPNFMISKVDVALDDKPYKVLIKDVQYHPLTGKPLHIDLFVIEPDQKIRVTLPIAFKNKQLCPGMKLGGILNVLTKGIKSVVSSNNIPEAVTFDLAQSNIGDAIRLKDLNIPSDVQVLSFTANTTLATIISPSKPKE